MPVTFILPAQIAALLPAQQPSAADAAANQLAGQAPPPAGTTGSAPAGGGAASPGTGLNFLLPILLAFVVFMIIVPAMSAKKDKRRRVDMLGSMKKHDRVQTIGGIIGTIVEIRDDDVLLKVDEGSNTRIRFAKSAVQQVIRPASGGDSDGASTVETKPRSEKAAV